MDDESGESMKPMDKVAFIQNYLVKTSLMQQATSPLPPSDYRRVYGHVHDVVPRRTKQYFLEDFADAADGVVPMADTGTDGTEMGDDVSQGGMVPGFQRAHELL